MAIPPDEETLTYMQGLDLFAYMEVEDFQRFLSVMAASRASEHWEKYVSDILIRETDTTTGFPSLLPEVFHLDRVRGVSAKSG